MSFTLEKLSVSDHKITIDDCKALFDYAKLLYEMQLYVRKSNYKILTILEAEKYLYNLKEILGSST